MEQTLDQKETKLEYHWKMDKKIRRAHEAQSLKLWEQVQRTVENVLKGKALMRTEKKERGYINNIQKIL